MHVLMFSGLTWTNHILFRYSFLQVKGEDCILKKKSYIPQHFSKLQRLIAVSSITDEHTNCRHVLYMFSTSHIKGQLSTPETRKV